MGMTVYFKDGVENVDIVAMDSKEWLGIVERIDI